MSELGSKRAAERAIREFERKLAHRFDRWRRLCHEVHILRVIVSTPSDGSESRAQCEARLPLALAEKIAAQRDLESFVGKDFLRTIGMERDAEIFLEVYEPEGAVQ